MTATATDVLDLQVTPLLLLTVSSGSLSRRCPPSSFVAAQRAVRRQGCRVARRLRRCALPGSRSFQPSWSHNHLAFPPNRFLFINVQRASNIFVKIQTLCCWNLDTYIRFIFLLDRCASNALSHKRHHGSGWAVHMSRAPGSLDFGLYGSTKSSAMASEQVPTWRAWARWSWCRTREWCLNRQANYVVSVVVHAYLAFHVAVWYIIN
jgi:hypothetical protein